MRQRTVHLCGFTYCDRLAWNAERERCVIGDYGRRVTNADSGADSDTFSDGNAYTYTYAYGYTDADALTCAGDDSNESHRSHF